MTTAPPATATHPDTWHQPNRSPHSATGWDRAAVGLLGVLGFALSYSALQQMAMAVHVLRPLSYAYPPLVDGFIAYGVRAVLVLRAAPLHARLYAWVLFGAATSASIWANALHALDLNKPGTTQLHLGNPAVVVLSAIPPLALGGATHLHVLISRYGSAGTNPAGPLRIWRPEPIHRLWTGLADPPEPRPRFWTASHRPRTRSPPSRPRPRTARPRRRPPPEPSTNSSPLATPAAHRCRRSPRQTTAVQVRARRRVLDRARSPAREAARPRPPWTNSPRPSARHTRILTRSPARVPERRSPTPV